MHKRRTAGFTLIELMVVVAVVAILAAIALPSFADQMRKSRRSEAISALQASQLELERYRVDHADYSGNPKFPASQSINNWYDFSLTNATATSYTLTAAPKSSQANDVCGTLSIAYAAGTLTKSPNNSSCW